MGQSADPCVADGAETRVRGLTHDTQTRSPHAAEPLGTFEQLEAILDAEHPDLVLVTFPVAMSAQIDEVAARLNQLGVVWRFLPMLADLLAGRAIPPSITRGATVTRSASVGLACSADPLALLSRRPHPLDDAAIRRTLAGRNVMITGAGGSIGSELARLVCRFGPAKLILVERAENALFEIDRHVAQAHPEVARSAVLHDVTDGPRTRSVLALQQPHVIFHAAAHKHVPMMEEHPWAAVENNFYGTRTLADAAHAVGVERFVMISSDKAVNPTSVMGATKRLAELYIQHFNAQSDTTFSMVRFGNVLGSACSVLPIWAQQIAEGGPVTVTHPDMHRYFMTIPEAAGLVLQSAAFSGTTGGGEVFLLDMGKPIRVLDLARRFIQVHGLEPEVDVRIAYTGIRPGEKLFEELAYDGEDLLPTPHVSVRLWRARPVAAPRMNTIITTFDKLRQKATPDGHHWDRATPQAILAALHASIPEMQPPQIQALAV